MTRRRKSAEPGAVERAPAQLDRLDTLDVTTPPVVSDSSSSCAQAKVGGKRRGPYGAKGAKSPGFRVSLSTDPNYVVPADRQADPIVVDFGLVDDAAIMRLARLLVEKAAAEVLGHVEEPPNSDAAGVRAPTAPEEKMP